MPYRFAAFELDEERYELRRDGSVIELQPKVMDVLLHLVRNADRACSKDELIDSVWGDVNVSEGSLVRCIVVARRALDESEGDAEIIQTVRGHGYRIGVPVEAVPNAVGAEIDDYKFDVGIYPETTLDGGCAGPDMGALESGEP